MNNPILQNIYQSLPSEYKDFIDSEYIDAIAQKLGAEHNLEQPDVVVVRNGFMLYLHFILSGSELANFFIEEAGIEPLTAQALSNEFLIDLPTAFTNQHSQVIQELRTAPAEAGATTPANEAVQPGIEQSYSSTQDDLLRRDPPPTPPQN